ncbi:MAG TPA: helix-turn-helix domain-containing protein [Flavobacteriales bacterium]|nr:helix-turn-helix domain-containing protein [Flavobacteriales bacterium]HNK68465.1 helix-turn-helix domain-containing protein [Flavobacteriales bacterium]
MEHRREQKRIALRLLELRLAHGLSQEDLAEVLAIGQSAYSELESAHVKLSAERAIKLAGLYRMSVDDLLLGTGTGNREQGTHESRSYVDLRELGMRWSGHVDGPMKKRTSPRCIIIADPNGAGKTTFARQFLTEAEGVLHFVNADLIASGLSPLHPELAARAAGRLLLSELERLTRKGESFALESTLSGRTYVDLLRRMKDNGYRIEIVFLRLESLELAIRRVAHRVKHGGHHVPDADVRRRYERGWPNFAALYRPLADVWAVYENSGPVPLLLERHP